MFNTLKLDRETYEMQNIREAYDPVSARSSSHQACDRCHEKKVRRSCPVVSLVSFRLLETAPPQTLLSASVVSGRRLPLYENQLLTNLLLLAQVQRRKDGLRSLHGWSAPLPVHPWHVSWVASRETPQPAPLWRTKRAGRDA
jgi:hypothetical protein